MTTECYTVLVPIQEIFVTKVTGVVRTFYVIIGTVYVLLWLPSEETSTSSVSDIHRHFGPDESRVRV